jgi:hypothetical protein
MAFGVKYRLEFSDLKENKRKVEILKDSYTGSVLPMVASGNPVVIDWQKNDDFYSNIIGSSCTLNLKATDSVTYENFLINGEDEWKIRVSHWNGASYDVYWEGFVVIDGYVEAIASAPYDITLKAFDGLGLLKGHEAPYSDTSAVDNYDTLFYYLRQILALTGNDFDIYVSNRIREASGAANDTIFHDIDVNEFGVMKKNLTYRNAKELLELILKITNSRVFQSYGRWYIVSNSNLIDSNITSTINIRGDQTTRLTTFGTENIEYKIFNSAGVYQSTITPDILLTAPAVMKPIDNDLVAEHLRPFKSVTLKTDIYTNLVLNHNPHFLYDSNHYGITVTGSGNYGAVVSDSTYPVKALSAGKYFHTNDLETTTSGTWIGNLALDRSYQTVRQNAAMEVGFNYYIVSTTPATYELGLRVYVDPDDTLPHRYYNFTNDTWDLDAQPTDDNVKILSTSSLNGWGQFKVNLKPFRYVDSGGAIIDAEETPKIGATITRLDKTGGTGTYTKHYIDNFYVAEVIEVDGDTYVYKREKQVTNQTETYTIEDNRISNELNDLETLNSFSGDFNKPRYGASNYSLDMIITNETLNDFRLYGKRYEGTFYKNDASNLACGMHHKIWLNFGSSILQEPVSCYIDYMTYNVKQNSYKISMHVPNQEVDVYADTYESTE